MENPTILRTENGKPYVLNGPQFSITHTSERWYVALSDKTVGIDAELLSRTPNVSSVVKKFPVDEQKEILSTKDFLTHWVVKESAVKFLGGTLGKDLKRLAFINGELFYERSPFPVRVTLIEHENHVVSVCCEQDFSKVTFEKI